MKMKTQTLKILLIATLLTNISAMAMTAKVNNENKIIYAVLEGSSSQANGKPGLAAEVNYKSEHVDVGVSSDVNITITTGLSKGILNVNLRPLEKTTIDVAEKDFKFTLSKGGNSFPIHLQVSSQINGIHYINLTLSVEGQGLRVVSVPVNVGKVSEKMNNNKAVEKTENGAISVSLAEEEIK